MRTAVIFSSLVLALWGGQASAHARLLRAAPRVGSTVARPPAELRLWFSETIDLAQSGVTLGGPGGAAISVGPLRLDPNDPRVVIAPLAARLGPAAYRVRWNMTSADTHHTDGDFAFKVRP